MSITEKLFSFNGRLRRRDWWLFVVLLGVAQVIVQIVANMATGGSAAMFTSPAAMSAPGAMAAFTHSLIVRAVVSLVFLWPALAIGVKRLHDRNRSGWWLAIFYLVVCVQEAMGYVQAQRLAAGGMPTPNVAYLALLAIFLIAAIWLLIELGFLDGTQGSNRFGPSPKGIEDV
jgi:uncharacterized membrane protein YhaH (DUF805 family)